LPLPRHFQIGPRRRLAFFLEPVQQHHFCGADAEDHAGNPAIRQVAPDFSQATVQGAAEWHPEGPAILGARNILTDTKTISRVQRLQPVPHGFGSVRRAVEDCRQSL
jgi:hypothetical protein